MRRLNRPEKWPKEHNRDNRDKHKGPCHRALVRFKLIPNIAPLVARWFESSASDRSVIADPWVKNAVKDVGNQIKKDDQEGKDKGQRLHHRQIICLNGPDKS